MVSTLIICSEGLLTYLRIEARSRGIDRPTTSVPLLPTSPGRGRAETTHPADQRAACRDPQIARATRRKLSGIAGSQTKTTGEMIRQPLFIFRYHSCCCSVGKSTSILVDTSAWSTHQTSVVREIFQNVMPSEAVDAGGAMARARWVQVYLHIPVITDYTSFTTTTATTVTTVPCLASCCGMVVQISLSEA